MTRTPLVSLWVMAAALGVGAAQAEQSSPRLKDEPRPARATPPARPRTVSPETTAHLNSALPKFDATLPRPDTAAIARPGETTAAAKPAEPLPDWRDIDKPRNTIVRLPEYVVQEQVPPVVKERVVETPKARLDRALKRNPGLRFGNFWIFRNDGIALAMQEEEERLVRMKETYELLTLLPAAEQARVKPVVDQTFMRP